MKRLFIVAGIIMLLISSAPLWALAKDTPALWMSVKVKRVVDGDTFVFRNGIDDRCRMVGYNAPEKNEDTILFLKATTELTYILKGDYIFIYVERRDNWNRMLCQVYLADGTDVNAHMREWLEDMNYKGVGKYDYLGVSY